MHWLFSIATALGNGQSTHAWISQQAVSVLAPGELRALMSDPELELYWRNGTMFPDGGYPIGDDYGEIAHWEPFQRAYMVWIQQQFQPPWTDEAQRHIAFWLGLASHGMADQTFDAMYFRRAYVYDADSDFSLSFDQAHDVVFIADNGPQPAPQAWFPTEVLLPLFEDAGHTVSESTLNQGQAYLQVAITWVAGAAENQPELVQDYRAHFPWGNAHLNDRSVPGSPPLEVELVANYWQSLWAELNDSGPPLPVLGVFPADGSYSVERDHQSIEASLSVVLPKAIDADLLSEDQLLVLGPEGQSMPIGVDLFYGDNSHVLNLSPLSDWGEGEHVLQLNGIPYIDGSVLELWESRFSTSAAPDPDAPKRGCSSLGAAGAQSWALLFPLLLRRRGQGA